MMQAQQASFTRSAPTTSIRRVLAPHLKHVITDLVDLFTDTVNAGSPLGFLPPITREEARDYWISLLPELASGVRVLIIAFSEDGVMGSGQLLLSERTNSPHRAEVQRLFVGRTVRGQGLGTSLMHALHDFAGRNGRSLILLNTRHGGLAEGLFRSLGYKEVGVIPGWTIGPEGERYDHVQLYHELGPV